MKILEFYSRQFKFFKCGAKIVFDACSEKRKSWENSIPAFPAEYRVGRSWPKETNRLKGQKIQEKIKQKKSENKTETETKNCIYEETVLSQYSTQ